MTKIFDHKHFAAFNSRSGRRAIRHRSSPPPASDQPIDTAAVLLNN